MKCNAAREILNSVFDGDEHALAGQAREHLTECADCRDWHTSMTRTLALLDSSDEPIVPDIAAMVSRKLPAAHRAASRGAGHWAPLGLLALLAAGPLMGVLAAVLMWGYASRSLGGGWVWQAVSVSRTLSSVPNALPAAGRALISIAAQILAALARVMVGFGPVLLWAIALNLAILIVVVMIWRRRPRMTSACLI